MDASTIGAAARSWSVIGGFVTVNDNVPWLLVVTTGCEKNSFFTAAQPDKHKTALLKSRTVLMINQRSQ